MKAKTNHKMTKQEFEVLKTTIKNTMQINRMRKDNADFYADMPKYVGLKLTNDCNLRCKHCYQWNESGYHRFMDEKREASELPIEVIKQILEETEEEKARLYLWGGEPFVYTKINELIELLQEYDREVAICTNVLLAERYLDGLAKLNKLELLIGLEGPEQIHDSIRGKGTYKKAINIVNALIERKQKGLFNGKISVHTMISDRIRNNLFDYLCFLEKVGIDMVVVCFPWYIADGCKVEMDHYFHKMCTYLPSYSNVERPSWYSFNYNIDEQYIDCFISQFELINQKRWNMVIRYQPDLEGAEIKKFILGESLKSDRKCLAVLERTEINPDCSVSACKFFDEFKIGNLKEKSLREIWHSKIYCDFRSMLCDQQMPICSKCSELYLHGMEERSQ